MALGHLSHFTAAGLRAARSGDIHQTLRSSTSLPPGGPVPQAPRSWVQGRPEDLSYLTVSAGGPEARPDAARTRHVVLKLRASTGRSEGTATYGAGTGLGSPPGAESRGDRQWVAPCRP